MSTGVSGVVYRESFGAGATASLIRTALRIEPVIQLEYLTRAVLSLCELMERQQTQIRTLEDQCAALRTNSGERGKSRSPLDS